FGDDTAEQMGRLNLNPLSHIDPIGLLMVVMVGFGYAKPVPINPRKMRHPWASAVVAFAGPFMNLVLAVIAVNVLVWGNMNNISFLQGEGQVTMLIFMAQINLLLMLFNLIPLGPLDGHYILPYFLPGNLGYRYHQLNAQYGAFALMGLILLSIAGVPVFSTLMSFSQRLLPLITFVG
ncbi:MAG: site-2 protease family protein, partial [Gammaproteobacteria bacterium]|nr:site-2 protease family protein [Gammaproteobacteria bacterium]